MYSEHLKVTHALLMSEFAHWIVHHNEANEPMY